VPKDLDAAQRARLQDVERRLEQGASPTIEDIFLSEHVVRTFEKEKTFVDGYRLSTILGLLPFTPTVYMRICPLCIGEQHYPKFVKLVESGLVVPILYSPYSKYPSKIAEVITSHDHISKHEFDLYREHAITRSFALLDKNVTHPVFKEMHDVVEGRRNKQVYLRHVHGIYFNLQPYTESDAEFIEIAARACRDKKLGLLTQLDRLGRTVASLRSAQVLNASFYLPTSEIQNLPDQLTKEADEARFVSMRLQELIASGLGIRIPTDLPIEAYIELVKDYQPRISSTVGHVVAADGSHRPLPELIKQVSSINREIERIKGLRRYAVLEAGVGFYKNNAMLVGGTLLAAALGFTTGLMGCAAAGALAAGGNLARKKGWLPDNPAFQRLGRMVVRDIQPYTDILMKGYLGGTAPAINVLSIQKRIEAARNPKQRVSRPASFTKAK
jgi:hypothetical protein